MEARDHLVNRALFLYFDHNLIHLGIPSTGIKSPLHMLDSQDMGKVPVTYIFAAALPAVMIAGLYFFDHSVASQMAQQKEFNLQNPSAYHYDVFLLGIMVNICNLVSFTLCIYIYPLPNQALLPTSQTAVFLLLQTLICGLIGLPPSNGVLPQSPMHTKSLAVLKRQVFKH